MALAFCLQTYGSTTGRGDIRSAVDLCKLIADIEEQPRSDVFFMCVFRRDTPIDLRNACVSHLSSKFRTQGFVAKNFATGHPAGSNMLWVSAMTEIEYMFREHQKAEQQKKGRGKFPYTGVLTFEADCVPLRRDWIDALTKEWNEKVINLGEWTEDNEDVEKGHVNGWPKFECMGHREEDHINGNMILRPDIHIRYPNCFQYTQNIGWDFYNQHFFCSVGCDTDLILQHYRRKTISRSEIPFLIKNGTVPALFHGVQDEVGRKARQFMREILVKGREVAA